MKTYRDKNQPSSHSPRPNKIGRGGLATGGSESHLRGMSSEKKKEELANQKRIESALNKVQTIIEERQNIKNHLPIVR